jgi:predicted phage terminase large subunit-like protein
MPSCLSLLVKGVTTLSQAKTKRCSFCETETQEQLLDLTYGVCARCTRLISSKYPGHYKEKVEEFLDRGFEDVTEMHELYDEGVHKYFAEKQRLFSAQEAAKEEIARRILRRRHLLPYIEFNVPDYMAGWVHKDITQRLEKFMQDVADKKSPRLMLFMPPRHGKSEIASVNFPAWMLGHYPRFEVIACSYSSSLAMAFSRKVREQLRSKAYKETFTETRLDPKSQSAETWNTTAGGGYVAAGVSGPITGKGAHVLIIDDPVKNREEAESENQQRLVYDWYRSTAYTRLAPGGGVLIILTRWHDLDLAGQLLAEEDGDKWEVIRYPAIATEKEPFREIGEALHRDRYDEEALNRIRKAVGPRDFEALYQQNPVPDSGDYFKREDLQYYSREDLKYDNLHIYTAWDLAIGQKEQNDYSVGLTVGFDQDENLYILDVVRGRWDGFNLVEEILDSYELWMPSIVGIERGHIEMAIGPFLRKRIRERKLFSMYVADLAVGRRDKQARARSIQGRIQQGKVFFPKDLKGETLIAEMLRFPNGAHDDQVDALAWIGQMLEEYNVVPVPKEEKKKSWRDKLKKLANTKSPNGSHMAA